MAQTGNWVRLKTLPPWVDLLPQESQEIFRFCVGRTYRVDEIDENGLIVLDVSGDVDTRFGGYGNDIRVEEMYLDVVDGPQTTP